MKVKNVYIIAGPNGSGKTTFARGYEGTMSSTRQKCLSLQDKAELAIKEAVRKVNERHKKNRTPAGGLGKRQSAVYLRRRSAAQAVTRNCSEL